MASHSLNRQHTPTSARLRRLLVIERDPDTQALYRVMFDPGRYSIEQSDDGADALGKAIATCPDLILTETSIPRIDGFALCRLLRADITTRLIPIVVASTAATPTDRMRATLAGADAVFAKPFSPDQVIEAVDMILERISPTSVISRTSHTIGDR